MPYRYQMINKNEHGDNGWWKKTGDTMSHYFFKKLPLCGTHKFNSQNIGVQQKTAYDKRCKNCAKVRRNQLRARMNFWSEMYQAEGNTLLKLVSHSPGKPQ